MQNRTFRNSEYTKWSKNIFKLKLAKNLTFQDSPLSLMNAANIAPSFGPETESHFPSECSKSYVASTGNCSEWMIFVLMVCKTDRFEFNYFLLNQT